VTNLFGVVSHRLAFCVSLHVHAAAKFYPDFTTFSKAVYRVCALTHNGELEHRILIIFHCLAEKNVARLNGMSEFYAVV